MLYFQIHLTHKHVLAYLRAMKKLIFGFAIISLLGLFANCASGASAGNMTVSRFDTRVKIGDKIFIKMARGGSETLPFWKSNISNEELTRAVKKSLIGSRMFRRLSSEWGEDWGLEIKLINVDQPYFGLDATVGTKIRYTLYKKEKEVYTVTIRADGTATIAEQFIGVYRLQLANEKSGRNNIK